MLAFYLSLIETQEDKVKFSDIYYKYRGFVQAIAREVTKNYELSQDAEQEAFEKIIKYLKCIKNVNSPETKTFIAVITRSASIDMMRREGKHLNVDPYQDAVLVPKDYSVEKEIIDKELREKIDALDDFYRDPIILTYFYGMRSKEVADALHTTSSAVRKRLQRGRDLLSANLKDWR